MATQYLSLSLSLKFSMPFYRERPAAIPIEIKSIDDTSNFDDFPESDILQPGKIMYNTTLLLKTGGGACISPMNCLHS